MKLIIFEDNQCETMRPVGLFTPLFDVHVANWTLHELLLLLGLPTMTVVRKHLLGTDETNADPASFGDEPILFINASVEPDVNFLETLSRYVSSGDPFLTTERNQVTAALVPAGTRFPDELCTEDISGFLLGLGLPLESETLRVIDWPHEIVRSHVALFDHNLDYRLKLGGYREDVPGLFVDDAAQIHPSCVIDTTNGPVVIESGVSIKPFTYIEGPVYIGKNVRILEHAAVKDRTMIAESCKIGGEIEATVIEPYTNKQHHGFLGHSWVGSWVNLGAGTTTSDLKNTYGSIRMEYDHDHVETDMQFLGAIIGDYSKTAINTSLFTGKVIGVNSMVYGMVTTNVPSFTNYARSFGQVREISLKQVLTTQKRVFERRDREQSPNDVELMCRVFEITRSERAMSEEQINF
jgi:UDP-N-acetylglucosamine diphosphorylase / glucose-1-phosphate thymidylyltransferase / UDP-N-acetylgalactosamine diphosphorylase / glucosamine-1-phosphate N-acetyltransferase / galactosamine-1-phosphate N-acetyltransferase